MVPDSHRYLLDRVAPAMVSTVNPDGSLQTTPVWFLFEDGAPRFSSLYSSRRVRNLLARPQCNFFVLDLEDTDRYLEVRGSARVEDDGDYAFADRIGARYSAEMRSYDSPGDRRAAVTVLPAKINAVDVG